MTTAEKLKTALSTLGYPVFQLRYDGSATAFFVFRIDSAPELFADDRSQCYVDTVSVHFYSDYRVNTSTLRSSVRTALEGIGCTSPSISDVSSTSKSSDGTEQHIVWVCEVEHDE